MAEKREAERDILPGFHRKKSEFEFKLSYYNQKRRALSSSFFQSPGPDNICSHQAVHCHDDHIHQHWNGLRGSRTVQASDVIFCFCRSLCLICVTSRNILMSKPDISVRSFIIVTTVIVGKSISASVCSAGTSFPVTGFVTARRFPVLTYCGCLILAVSPVILFFYRGFSLVILKLYRYINAIHLLCNAVSLILGTLLFTNQILI